MLMPILIQVLFWIGIASCVIGGIYTMTQKNGFGPGLGILLFGPIAVRLYAEMLIVIFKINDSVSDIKEDTARLP